MTGQKLSRWTKTTVVVVTLLLVSVALSAVVFAGPAAAQSEGQADVVVLFDRSGSMDEVADDLQNETENLADELDSEGIDARYALITYDDQGDELTEVRQTFTSDTEDFKDSLDFDTPGGTENASNAILLAFDELDFRSDAQKIVVVITDEDDDGYEQAGETAINRLNDEDATLVAVSEPEADSGYSEEETLRHMAEEQADSGEWTDIGAASFTDVIADLIDVIKEETTTTTSDGTGPNFDIVEKSVEKDTVYPGEEVTATAVVENTGASGTFDAFVTTTRRVMYNEEVEIDSDDSHRFEIPVSFDSIGSYLLRIDGESLARVTVEEQPLNGDNIEIHDPSVKRSVVGPGESYNVSAVVENVGNRSGTAVVQFNAADNSSNSTTMGTESAALAPGESTTVTYEATAADDLSADRNRSWSVNNESAGNVTILAGDDLSTGVIDAYATPAEVRPGEEYEAVGVVYNPTDERQMKAVGFTPDNGGSPALRYVWVDANSAVEVTHTRTAPEDAEGSIGWRFNTQELEIPVVEG